MNPVDASYYRSRTLAQLLELAADAVDGNARDDLKRELRERSDSLLLAEAKPQPKLGRCMFCGYALTPADRGHMACRFCEPETDSSKVHEIDGPLESCHLRGMDDAALMEHAAEKVDEECFPAVVRELKERADERRQ